MFVYILVSLLVVLCGVQYKVITTIENLQAEINTTKVNAEVNIDDLEAKQTTLLKTITSQQEQLTSQQNTIEQLKQTLTDTHKSQWSDWTSWGDCFTSCSGNNGGRIQTRSREATVTGSKKSEQESRPCNAVLFGGLYTIM